MGCGWKKISFPLKYKPLENETRSFKKTNTYREPQKYVFIIVFGYRPVLAFIYPDR